MATIVVLEHAETFWWIPGVPWILLCFLGMIATAPIIIIAFAGAAGAQADWMGDSLTIMLFFVTPTVASIVISELLPDHLNPWEAILKTLADTDSDDTKTETELDGAGQPATRSDSKSEGDDKPQPESEGLSR